MFASAQDIDSAFQGAGSNAGLAIWCIDNLRVVPVPKSLYGKFYTGNAYLVLNTILLRSGRMQHDIHYWLGSGVTQAESALASDKALELDAVLGSCAVQYREVQSVETEKFLSYFKPCVIPIEGVFSSGLGSSTIETYEVCLLVCDGDHAVHVRAVPFSRSSLNHNDVFILDTASKIFLFSGCNATIQERAKGLEVAQYIKENKHSGFCEVAIIEDGKLVGDPEVGEFWTFFGGPAPIPRDLPSPIHRQPDFPSVKLYWISTNGKLCENGIGSLRGDMLCTNKCYMLDCDSHIFVWMGNNTTLTERKASISAAEDLLRSEGRPTGTHVTCLTEGSETATFRSYFNNWPQSVKPKLYEEGREKVAAMFKQHGYNVKELTEEDCELCLDPSGTLNVWWVNGDQLSLLPIHKQKRVFSADCYIMQYTYLSDGRDENIFYLWLGQASVMEDRLDAISHLNAIVGSKKGNPAVAQVMEGKEPLQLLRILQTLLVFKGGMSTRYKKLIGEKGLSDETYGERKTALFRVQGTTPYNMQAIQVDLVSSSLNSAYCYVLQTESCIYTWVGSLTSIKDKTFLDKMLSLINPTWQPILVNEGREPDPFWKLLGGKVEYSREKENRLTYVEDPHLFKCTFINGHFKVKEIFNFTQDDLTTEDVFVLDCSQEIFVWIGCHSNIESKQESLVIGQRFLEMDILVEGLSSETPIYVVSQGYEPALFTRFFDWDLLKANLHGNTFERKLAILKGKPQKLEAALRNSQLTYSPKGPPDDQKSKSASSNGLRRSLSPASGVSESDLKSAGNGHFSTPNSTARKLYSGGFPDHGSDGSEASVNGVTFSYEQLTVPSHCLAAGINVTRRESYLSEEEFQKRFEMAKGDFYKLPKWRQDKLKRLLNLF